MNNTEKPSVKIRLGPILGIIIVFLLFLRINHPKPSVAQGPTGNQVGINIVDPDVNRFLQAAQAVGPGGWVTVAVTAGQGAQLQQILDTNDSLGNQKVQVVVRRETWGRAPTAQDALSFTTMYGNLNTYGQQIYDMPWNEPNHLDWWGFSTSDQAAQVGANYFRSSYQTLKDSGLYGTKVIFMAPMVDQFYGNGSEFYRLLRTYDPNVMNYFQAIPMNLYVRYDPNTGIPSSYFIDSGIGYREVLKTFGFLNFSNIPVLALETGVIIGPGNPIYPPSYPGWLNFYNFLSYVTSAWGNDPNFFGFTPLSSPSFGNDYLLREFATILQQFVTPGAVGIYDLSEIQKIFEEWLKAAGLIECRDEQGNLIGYAIDEKGCEDLLSLLQPPTYPACINPSSETRVSRPDMCSTCDLNPPLTYACATTFAVNDTVSWRWEDSDFICPETGKHWVSRDWGGTITIDPNDVTVPFVGKKGAEDVKDYLADYFEGTAFYYGPDVDIEDCKKENPNEAERKACQEGVERIVAEGGVFRKLAPRDWQDKLKKEMIQRAKDSKAGTIENGIHDYLIAHAGYQMRLSTIVPPPDSPEARESWEKTPSGKIWAAVPMFSREDSPGEVLAQVNTKREDKVSPSNPVSKVDQVPHLARLFEVTQKLQELLMPWIKEEQSKAPEKTLLASSNPQVLGEKTLLAQANPPPPNPGFEARGSCSKSGNTYSVNAIISLTNAPGLRDISIHIGSEYWTTCPNSNTCTNLDAPTYNVTDSPGDIKSGPVFHFRADNVVPNFHFSGTYSIKLTVDGCEFIGAPAPPPEPSCGLVEPAPYDVCDFESISDENPNDTICCDPINIALSAIDQFENPNYQPCNYDIICDPICHRKLLNPECKTPETRDVSRQVKVDLLHPYLDQIWQQTTDSFRGLFNIFRPDIEPPFRDLDAHSYINYSFSGGSISPSSPWKFYFPHLGGIQLAKEWVLQTLNPSGEGGGRPPGPAAPTGPTTLDYTIDFRNRDITISDEAKNDVIQKVKNRWPATKIETQWNYVYNRAVSWVWNPAFVIALWIEESGASGKDAYDLGCLGAPKNNLTAQLNCLFTRPYAYKSFEEFMCMYSEGESAPCLFRINPDFPRGVKYWYDLLTQ